MRTRRGVRRAGNRRPPTLTDVLRIDRETYEPLIQKAWTAILARTGADGRLVDVCESTGTRGLTDEDYLRRTAILGRDDRGGGMAMFFATELAGL